MTVTIMKKAKNLKTRLGIFKRMGGNILGGNFLGGNFPGGIFPGESFSDTKAVTNCFGHALSLVDGDMVKNVYFFKVTCVVKVKLFMD